MLRKRGVSVLDGGSVKFRAGFQQTLTSFSKLCMNIDASPMRYYTTVLMYVHSCLSYNLKHQAFEKLMSKKIYTINKKK